jgi:hypothetical protein
MPESLRHPTSSSDSRPDPHRGSHDGSARTLVSGPPEGKTEASAPMARPVRTITVILERSPAPAEVGNGGKSWEAFGKAILIWLGERRSHDG